MAYGKSPSLDELLARGDVWRGSDTHAAPGELLRTGYPRLDRALGGGWPATGLTELVGEHAPIVGLRLLMPALAELTGRGDWTAWVAPPYIPYAPGLHQAGIYLERLVWVRPPSDTETLAATVDLVRSGTLAVVLAWPTVSVAHSELRRIQLAADDARTWTVLLQDGQAERQPSPARLRLSLATSTEGLQVSVLKRRGGAPVSAFEVEAGPYRL